MPSYQVRYGGKRGETMSLSLSDEKLVVRAKAAVPTRRAQVAQATRQRLAEYETVHEFQNAGVSVLAPRGAVAPRARTRNREALKQDPGLRFAGRALVDPVSDEPVVYTENFFVKFDDECKPTKLKSILKAYDLRIKRPIDYAHNAFFVEAKPGTGRAVFDLALELLKEDDVELSHPELVRPVRRRAAFPQQWHLKRTTIGGRVIDQHANVEAAWALSEGQGIVIAVIDDGVDLSHPEFAGSWKVVAPRDVTRGTDGPTPGNGDHHGTACAGVACANGTHGASGVAPRATLMPIRLASGLGSQQEADAFMWAAQHGADVISCSWGPQDGRWWDAADPTHRRTVPLPDSTRLAVDWAIEHGRNGKGCVITWAAGNGNESADNDGYASYGKVIAVAACNDLGRRSSYSDIGSCLWCSFPSSNGDPSNTPGIWTTDRTGAAGYNVGTTQLGDPSGNYTNDFGGTSSSCPGVAGVAALVLARNPELRWEEVKDVLRRACQKIDAAGGDYDAKAHSRLYGYGRVDAKKAVELAVVSETRYRTLHTAVQDVPVLDLQTSTLTLELAEKRVIAELGVEVDIEHTYRGDLIVKVHPPSECGIEPITLHNGEGAGQNDLKRRFDGASTPELRQLSGKSPAGVWKLSVYDRYKNDQGTLKRFGLDIVYA